MPRPHQCNIKGREPARAYKIIAFSIIATQENSFLSISMWVYSHLISIGNHMLLHEQQLIARGAAECN